MTQIAALPHRALIGFTGPDWAKFLQGQSTINLDKIMADVEAGRLNKLYYAAFLTPQGKMITDAFIYTVSAEEAWLDIPRDLRDEMFTRLNLYKLRAKITLSKLDNPVFAAFGGPLLAGFSEDPRAAIIGQDGQLGLSYAPQIATAELSAWIDYRLTHGLSDPVFDYPREYLYPIDANLDLLEAIDFKKGCFVGQETTSRMKRRGHIKNRILPLKVTIDAPFETEVLNGERRAGEILTSQPPRALGLMRLDRTSGALTVSGQAATLDIPDWLQPHIAVANPAG
ncbi:folate-binding protein [Asticcacaulis sp. SL142]|jgi:tRNA-modifying protein YgfZ|uniref:CAF17-like 4Fe-4S cluster assembly/insertion protein YgfZ n=1 Tax=Asticcacaulis sp. SL142 TaxID=2995155 RepID=UPI00226CCA7F|nr:folate-binding protein [Asticcacaulis sp. SL142]WAC49114.1 folate-binding protein [Asticcacaulis sp. SL142]